MIEKIYKNKYMAICDNCEFLRLYKEWEEVKKPIKMRGYYGNDYKCSICEKIMRSYKERPLYCPDCGGRMMDMGKDLQDAFNDGYKQAMQDGWIPVNEGLPGDRKIVLQVTIKRLKDDYTWVQSLLWDYDKWKWWEEDDKKVDASRFKILAWQSLPGPYKEENYD